jgi:SAM-dependent methyltransferase
MRQAVKDFVKIVGDSIKIPAPIFEFGSLQVPGQEGFADLRLLFPNKKYIGCDMREGPGVDKILDLHDISIPSETVGTALCLETLEHVEFPHRALKEIYRILKPEGVVVISSAMKLHIHDYPNDYWRFTPAAFKLLLAPFSSSFVGFGGNINFPDTIVGIGFKDGEPSLRKFRAKYIKWQKNQKKTIGYILESVVPPVLFPFISKIKLRKSKKI